MKSDDFAKNCFVVDTLILSCIFFQIEYVYQLTTLVLKINSVKYNTDLCFYSKSTAPFKFSIKQNFNNC